LHALRFDLVDDNGELPADVAEDPAPPSVQRALEESQRAAEKRAADATPIYSTWDAGNVHQSTFIMYVCICIYIYTYTHIHTYIHKYILILVYEHIHLEVFKKSWISS
jgi:hypothetical protein